MLVDDGSASGANGGSGAGGSGDEAVAPPGGLMNLGDALQSCLHGNASMDLLRGVVGMERLVSVEEVLQVLRDPFGSATKKTRENLADAWRLWLAFCAENAVDAKEWPPTEDVWVTFLTVLRGSTTAAQYQSTVVRVGTVGSRMFGGASPVKLYSTAQHRVSTMLNRHYGRVAKQSLGITMTEARNFPYFCSKLDAAGFCRGAAFAFGIISGGRRARSACGIRLGDMVMTVGGVVVDGVEVLVPQCTVRISDEKFMDNMGARQTGEHLDGMHDYADLGMHTFSWWAYRFLVLRGAFRAFDPMKFADVRKGDVLEFKDDANLWFLFCMTRRCVFVNTVPASPRGMSTMTRQLLDDMGMPSRGYSAHRKGSITRAMQFALLKSGGKAVDEALESALVRWGGWHLFKGKETVRQRYIQMVLDDVLDTVGLGHARDMSEDEVAARLQAFKGVDLPRPAPGSLSMTKLPMVVQFLAMEDVQFAAFQSEVDNAGLVLLSAAKCHGDISLFDRYTDGADMVAAIRRAYPRSEAVRVWNRLRGQHSTRWNAACKRAIALLRGQVRECSPLLEGCTADDVLRRALPYEFGGWAPLDTRLKCTHRVCLSPGEGHSVVPVAFCVAPKGTCACCQHA